MRLKLFMALSCVALVSLSCVLAQAADKVVAVAAARSVNDILDAVGKTAIKINEPGIPLSLAGVQMAINIEGPFGGFDLTRPVALVVFADKTGYLALPVKNIDVVKQKFFKPGEGDSLKELEDAKGVFEFVSHKQPGKKAYLRVLEGWLLIAGDKKGVPESVDSETIDTVKALTEEYLLAVQFNVKSIDKKDRMKAIADLKEAIKENHVDYDSAPAIVRELSKQWGAKITKAAETYLKDNPELSLGLKVDAEKGLCLEAKFKAAAGSKSAKALNKLKNVKTRLAGFYQPEAALAFRMAGKAKLCSEEQLDKILNEIGKCLFEQVDEKVKDEAKNAQAKKALVALKGVVVNTIKDGNWDKAVSAWVSPDKGVSLVGARYCSDGKEMEKLADDISKTIVECNPNKAEELKKCLKVNADSVNNVQIHVITLHIPEQCFSKTKKFVGGDNLVIALGFGKNIVSYAIGGNALENLKTALKNSEKAQQASVLEITCRPLEFLKTAEEFCPRMKKCEKELNEFKLAMGDTYKKCGLERLEIGSTDNGLVIRYSLSYSGLKAKIKGFPQRFQKEKCDK